MSNVHLREAIKASTEADRLADEVSRDTTQEELIQLRKAVRLLLLWADGMEETKFDPRFLSDKI